MVVAVTTMAEQQQQAYAQAPTSQSTTQHIAIDTLGIDNTCTFVQWACTCINTAFSSLLPFHSICPTPILLLACARLAVSTTWSPDTDHKAINISEPAEKSLVPFGRLADRAASLTAVKFGSPLRL